MVRALLNLVITAWVENIWPVAHDVHYLVNPIESTDMLHYSGAKAA